MANVLAIHSVGNSIVTFLRNTYPQTVNGQEMPDCGFDLLSSGELADSSQSGNRLALYLYRVTVNEHCRQLRHNPGQPLPALGLDLHYLLMAWGDNAREEQLPLAWAMRQLYQYPILDASSLSPEAGWGADEIIQIIPSELPTEDMMRIWDALDPAYRLSASYIVRLVRIDLDSHPDAKPVVASRFGHGNAEPAGSQS